MPCRMACPVREVGNEDWSSTEGKERKGGRPGSPESLRKQRERAAVQQNVVYHNVKRPRSTAGGGCSAPAGRTDKWMLHRTEEKLKQQTGNIGPEHRHDQQRRDRDVDVNTPGGREPRPQPRVGKPQPAAESQGAVEGVESGRAVELVPETTPQTRRRE